MVSYTKDAFYIRHNYLDKKKVWNNPSSKILTFIVHNANYDVQIIQRRFVLGGNTFRNLFDAFYSSNIIWHHYGTITAT